MKATVSSVPSYLASSCSWAWPTSWVMATSSRPVAAHAQPHRRGLAGHQLHAAHRVEQRLAADGEHVRVARRDEAAVVGELALDQAGGELAREPTSKVASRSPRRRVTSSVPREQPLELAQRPRRHEHALALAQHARAREVADREPVGVGGHQAQAVGLGGHEHAGEDRPGVVGAGRRARPGAGRRRSPAPTSVTASSAGAPSRGNSSAGSSRMADWKRPAVMWASSPSTSTVDLAGLERAHDVGREPGRQHRDAVVLPGRPAASTAIVRSRSLPVRLQAVALQLDPDAGQHRERAAPVRHGTAGGAEGFDQDVTLASELHAVVLSLLSSRR